MTTQNHARPSLDDVLEQYAAEGPSYEALNDYARRFPEYRDALADFTVQWSAMEHAELGDTDGEESDVEASLNAVRSLLQQNTTTDPVPSAESGAPPSPAVPQLASSAGGAPGSPAERFEDMLIRLGIDTFDFQDQSGLGYSFILNLSKGCWTFDSVEEKDCTARAILDHIRTFNPDPIPPLPAVRQSITQPPMIAAGQSSSRDHKPEAVTKPFRQGIEDARDMTDEAKAAWLRILDEAC
ncbi:hypothetical protein B1759_15765 [Rubrivirga sp. SAORIC476]|uniref:hypothetical protein n=1 Tax=Rubrivirga sp. SAORIC476 TaxID=1961794 RepID=UPI000BA9C9F8|nr:hypothetical protein [Rubrivirga sp. SAORIC476]PAP78896.1 hypothetical protein B1759_15765 [Rubrivirga sp. SAORIC476]